MYESKDLSNEISAKLEWLRKHNGEVLHPEWVTKSVLDDHKEIHGEDADFFLYNARVNVRNEVRKQLNKYKLGTEIDRQLILPGFKRVQEYYLVKRDGEQCAVHVACLTHLEIAAKRAELRTMSEGCLEHEEELGRYAETRLSVAS